MIHSKNNIENPTNIIRRKIDKDGFYDIEVKIDPFLFDDDFDEEEEEEIQQQIDDLKFYNKKQIDEFKKTYEYHKSNNPNNQNNPTNQNNPNKQF